MDREVRSLGTRVSAAALVLALATGCTPTGGLTTPIAPANVVSTPGAGIIVVTWTDNSSNEAGFRIHREIVPASGLNAAAFEVIATTDPDVEEYVDHSVSAGVTYRYAVSAFNASGDSSPVAQSNPPIERGSLLKTLNLQLAGAGSGHVLSAPEGIDCGSDCSEAFEVGTSVVLTATPAAGSRFMEWAGDCTGDELTCVIEVSDNLHVVASFMPISVTPGKAVVSVAKAGDGAGHVASDPGGISCGEDCDATFTAGQVVTLSADASPGSSFAGWSGSGCSGTGTCVILTEDAHLVTATFTSLQYTLTVTTDGSGAITSNPAGIACGSDCTASFTASTTVTLQAAPASGHELLGWDGDCSGSNTTCLVEMTGAKSVSARFGERRIVVTSTSGDTGGPDCTLRDAITAANTDAPKGGCRAGSGADVIWLPEDATITLLERDNTASGNNGLPSISTPITIRGNGATIQRGATETKFRIFRVGASGHLTIDNLTVANGHGASLGGGGLLLDSGQAVVIESSITGNAADIGVESLGAGILNLRGSLTVDQSSFTGNGLQNQNFEEGPSSGAAIAVVDGTATITGSSMTGNHSENVGGIHSLGTGSTVTISSSNIADNFGKAINNEGSMWLTDVEILRNGNEATSGGLVNAGSAYLERVTFEGHFGEYSGTLVNYGYMQIVGSLIRNNRGLTIDGRGGIGNYGTMEIEQTQVSDNQSYDAGGGGIMNFWDAVLTIRESVIKGNSAAGSGGGIANSGRLEVIDSVVAGNFSDMGGGGISNNGSLRLSGTTSIGTTEGGNRTHGLGGGILVEAYTSVCTTCTVTGNQANGIRDGTPTPGGGIYVTRGRLELEDPTRVFGNTPDQVAP